MPYDMTMMIMKWILTGLTLAVTAGTSAASDFAALQRRGAGEILAAAAEIPVPPREASAVYPVIGPDGFLSPADGSPLAAFRAGEESARRYRLLAEAGMPQVIHAMEIGDVPYYGPALSLYTARELQRENPALRLVPEEELANISDYCDFGYLALNGPLWAGELPRDLDALSLLLSGLNRLPAYEGKALRADFYTDSPAGISPEKVRERLASYRSAMEQGRPFRPKAFWSASLANDQAMKERIQGSPLVLEIESLSGKLIAQASSRPYEEELLFLPGTAFRVLEISERKVQTPGGNPGATGYLVRLAEIR